MKRIFLATAALTLVLALADPAPAAETFKHSGTIVGFDEKTDSIVLAEVGPWQIREGVTVLTNRRILLTPNTDFVIAFRAEDPATGFAGDFIEVPLDRSAVYVDDYVTIECRHDGPRMVALKIIVMDLPGAAYRGEGNGSR